MKSHITHWQIACVQKLALGAVLVHASTGIVSADQIVKELQSSFTTVDKFVVTSSNLMKLVNSNLGMTYQDLEIIITSCRAGEFGERADGLGGLFGTWSLDTSSDTKNATTWVNTSQTKTGWPPNYISAVVADKTAGAKALFDTAKKNSQFPEDNPQYFSAAGNAAADNTSVHGGKTANFAVLFNTSDLEKGYRNLQVLKLYNALKAAGYTDATINYLAGKDLPNPPGIVDQTAKYADFVKAMQDLGKAVKGSAKPAETKAYVFVQAHGGLDERTVTYLDGQLGQPNGGVVVSNLNPSVQILADDPTVVQELKEEVPKSGGGFWADDPSAFRTQSPFLLFSTQQESFTGSTDVNIFLNNQLVGDVMMGNSQGADYQLPISDALLDSIFNGIDATGSVNLAFQFGNSSDSIRMAVKEDYLSPDYTHYDYGISLGSSLDTPDVVVPEPASFYLVLTAVAVVGIRRLRRVT